MSQTPQPNDPYGTDPGVSGPGPEKSWPAQDVDPETAQADGRTHDSEPGPGGEQAPVEGSPTSDPAQHPYDPYAYDPSAPSTSGRGTGPAPAGGGDPHGTPAGEPQAAPGSHDPYAAGGPAPAPGPGPQHSPYGADQQASYGPQQGPVHSEVPPAGLKGVYDGPISGTPPLSDSDARIWSLVAQLAALLQVVIPFIGGLIAQIVLFAVFKDRSRFVRYNAAEALNGTIAVLIIQIVLALLLIVPTVLTFGLLSFLYGLLPLLWVVQGIFAIIGAVKAHQGIWWNYPVNIRLVK